MKRFGDVFWFILFLFKMLPFFLLFPTAFLDIISSINLSQNNSIRPYGGRGVINKETLSKQERTYMSLLMVLFGLNPFRNLESGCVVSVLVQWVWSLFITMSQPDNAINAKTFSRLYLFYSFTKKVDRYTYVSAIYTVYCLRQKGEKLSKMDPNIVAN